MADQPCVAFGIRDWYYWRSLRRIHLSNVMGSDDDGSYVEVDTGEDDEDNTDFRYSY